MNFEVNIILPIFSLSELLMGHDVRIKTGDIDNVLKLEELPAYRRVDIDLDLAVALHI